LLVDSQGKNIESLGHWQPKREALRQWWLEFLGPMPAKRDAAPKWEVIETDRVEGVVRRRIRYEVEPGITTEAYLLEPEKRASKSPGVAVFHSTVDHSIRQPAGVQGRPEKFFGLKLAQRGCVTISPRNYLWPTNDRIAAQAEADNFHQRHPTSKGMARMLHDSLVAVDILTSLPYVDADRIGSVGHSLGAKEVLYLAAFDQRVKVTVSSEGGVSSTFSNWDAPWYLGETIKSADFTHEHHELVALAAPRPFLLLGGDSADGNQSWPFIEAALPVYRLYGPTPRLGLFNHRQGHAVPPEAETRIYQWFDKYL
jgi:dienelactone hydrolase